MTEITQKAIQLLNSGDYTCVAIKGEEIYTSVEHGIKPILMPLNQGLTIFEKADVADRIIGKSAALLLVLAKISSLYAKVLSEPAKAILDQYHIPVTYDELVPYVINRDKTDMCPMEKSVLNTNDPSEAFLILNQKVKEMMSKS